jgi:large subunit ribosomal protein L16
MPRKIRYKKQHKGNKSNKINSIFDLSQMKQSVFVLKSNGFGRLTEKQIDTCRMTISKNLKKFGRLIINLQSDTPVTKKPIEIRMGKGKGAVDYWACKVKYGTPLFTIQSNHKTIALNALKSGKIKLPILTKIVNYESHI